MKKYEVGTRLNMRKKPERADFEYWEGLREHEERSNPAGSLSGLICLQGKARRTRQSGRYLNQETELNIFYEVKYVSGRL